MQTFSPSPQRGSAFITVMGFVVILLLLLASVMKYSGSERRLNNRAKMLLESRMAAEAISEFGMAQVKNILETNKTFSDTSWSTSDQILFTTGTYGGTVTMPSPSFWSGGHILTSGSLAPTMHIGKILQVGGLQFVDPTNPDNDNDPLKGKKAFRYDMDILASATAYDATAGRAITKYWDQKFSIRAVPLFSNAVYYNMDLELWPISAMTITGSVHTNGRLFVRAAGGSAVSFAGAVTAVKGVWTKFSPLPYMTWYNETSASAEPGSGTVQIMVAGLSTYKPLNLASATTGFSPNLTSGTWVESTWNLTGNVSPSPGWKNHIGDVGADGIPGNGDDIASVETAATKENFADWSQQTFKGNLMTHVNGITAVNLQGIPDYNYVYGSAYPDPGTAATSAAYTYDTATGNDTNNSAHGLIERPMLSSETHYVQAIEDIKYSRQCALYIIANTTSAAATGHKPDGNTVTVPAGEYRCYMNNSGTITEVILPGQKMYNGSPGTANPHTNHKNARPIVQMKQITNYTTNVESVSAWPASARLMTDMRRSAGGDVATNDATTTFSFSAARSATNKFVPKVLKMIDIDMTELKKSLQVFGVAVGSTLVTSTSTANEQGKFYATGTATTTGSEFPIVKASPGSSGNWAYYIYRDAATQTTTTVGDTNRIFLPPTTAGVSTTMANAFTTSIWNGGIYVESIAAQAFDIAGGTAAIRKAKTHELHDSGVRLINGRGVVASVGTQGFTLATNDCVYILGHFNADGDDATPATVEVLTPPSVGASTGHNYETNEVPCSIAADAVYFLSNPTFSAATTQGTGWNDAFSAFACGGTASSSWDSAWATTAPSTANARDGLDGADTPPYKVPYDAGGGNQSTNNTTGRKFLPVFTEYSTAILCGLVPTGKNGVTQNSGGLHNFPGFIEDWYQSGSVIECRIRGSFVALYESRVRTEPWSGRFYAPPSRKFGFNLLFDSGLMPPLTPKTISPRRLSANDITKDAYNTMITGWGYTALP